MTSRVALVTGCAGFIGSHLAESLVDEGWRVRGVDAFTPHYDRADKEANLARIRDDSRFDLQELDLAEAPLDALMDGVHVLFHLAAQPGVRTSFGDGFAHYVRHNVLATQRVLEAARDGSIRRVVWASSSSVYGDAEEYPSREDSTATRPRSPYGVTKRACEDLASVYRAQGLPVVGLRYFTVYGPRQRPDMAMRRLCEALLAGEPFPVYGDGTQSRDFTFVEDAVDATLRAADAIDPEAIYNVGGGHEATLREIIASLERLTGIQAALEKHDEQPGDVRRTGADTTRAHRDLGWQPLTDLGEGLRRQFEWVKERQARSLRRARALALGSP
jgi:nucleoside-diphosphate-sugar epimerase